MPSYRRLLLYPAYGLFAGDRLIATAKAPTAEAARELFKAHNERHPDWQLEGDTVKRLGRGDDTRARIDNRDTGADTATASADSGWGDLERMAEQTRSPGYS